MFNKKVRVSNIVRSNRWIYKAFVTPSIGNHLNRSRFDWQMGAVFLSAILILSLWANAGSSWLSRMIPGRQSSRY